MFINEQIVVACSSQKSGNETKDKNVDNSHQYLISSTNDDSGSKSMPIKRNRLLSNIQENVSKKTCYDSPQSVSQGKNDCREGDNSDDHSSFNANSEAHMVSSSLNPVSEPSEYSDDKSSWTSNFKVRPEQSNRNCVRVPEEIKLKVVETVFHMVLNVNNALQTSSEEEKGWRRGGKFFC